MDETIEALRTFARGLPGAGDGISCAGTALERPTVTAGTGKAFLFLGPRDLLLKLRDSLSEATDRADEEPDRYKVGAHGWVTVAPDAPRELLERWIRESHGLFAGGRRRRVT